MDNCPWASMDNCPCMDIHKIVHAWISPCTLVDTGGIKAEFKDTVENEDKEFETVTMGYKWPK